MPTEVRPLETDAEFDAYLRAASYAFHTVRDDALLERYRSMYRPQWCLGAFDGNTLVAGLTIIPFEQFMFGARIPFGGIATVASLPEHRRGGHVGELLRVALSRMRDAGQALSGLYTPHFSLYRRYGWEPAYRVLSYSLAPKVVKPRAPRPAGAFTRMDADSWEMFAALREQLVPSANGALSRDEHRWRSQLFSDGALRPRDAVIWSDRDGRQRGYCIYSQQQRPGRGEHGETVMRVFDMVALDGDAHGALLHYLLSHDLAARVIVPASEDMAVASLVEEPALIQEPQGAYIGMALRLVDVPAAFEARPPGRGSAGVRLTLHIEDAAAPWNTGTWECASDGQRISASRLDEASADLCVDAVALGPLYNGFITPDAACRAGMLTARTPDAVDRLRSLLGVESRPFCLDDF